MIRIVKFSSVTHLSIFIKRNYADDDDVSTMVYFIGLKGDFISVNI